MRVLIIVVLVVLVALPAQAQTATPTETPTSTPTETFTPTSEPFVYMTVAPGEGTPTGQTTRFDYIATAGDVHVANLLTALLYSVWGMFFFGVFVMVVRYKLK